MRYAKFRITAPRVHHSAPYTLKQVCRYLGRPGYPINRTTIWRWSQKGIITPHFDNTGHCVFYGCEILSLWSLLTNGMIDGNYAPSVSGPVKTLCMKQYQKDRTSQINHDREVCNL